MLSMGPLLIFVIGSVCVAVAQDRNLLTDGRLVVVSGATGRSGRLIYKALKDQGVPVRAFVRNLTKARGVLGCDVCDNSEGIYLGDVTVPKSIVAVAAGAGALVIATTATPFCGMTPTGFNCTYNPGQYPLDVDWLGGKHQVDVFAMVARSSSQRPPMIAYVSSQSTTNLLTTNTGLPHQIFQFVNFYKLNAEAYIMSSHLPYFILKPCGLDDTPPAQKRLITTFDDEYLPKKPFVARSDVSRVIVKAVTSPWFRLHHGLRFDFCAESTGPPTTDEDLEKFLTEAATVIV